MKLNEFIQEVLICMQKDLSAEIKFEVYIDAEMNVVTSGANKVTIMVYRGAKSNG